MLKRPLSVLLMLTVGTSALASNKLCNKAMKGEMKTIEAEVTRDHELPFHDHQFLSNLQYLEEQDQRSYEHIYAAVGPKSLVSDAHPGSILASPSTFIPGVPSQDYRYYWKRDGALVARVIYLRWIRALKDNDGELSQKLERMLMDWTDYTALLQSQGNESGAAYDRGVADPKHFLSGKVFRDGWVRPQNDGPSLEAYTQMLIAEKLIELGKGNLVREKFYNPDPAKHSVIQVNLAVTLKYAEEINGNVWEDKYGFHFYNLQAHIAALKYADGFLQRLGYREQAEQCRRAAEHLMPRRDEFYDAKAGYLRATINALPGYDPKSSLDAEVMLAILHSSEDLGPYSPLDDRVLQTMDKYVKSFENLYAINQVKKSDTGEDLGTAVGRYQEDIYDGYTSNAQTRGNPWFLTTLGMAEFHFRFEKSLMQSGAIDVTDRNLEFFKTLGLKKIPVVGGKFRKGTPEFNELITANRARAAGYIQRVKYHAGKDGHLSEQFNRDSGYMQGVEDLTWSHAAIVSLKHVIDQLSPKAISFLRFMNISGR